MPFRMYNDLMGLAKESLQQAEGPEGGEAGKGPGLMDRGSQTEPEVVALVEKLHTLLQELPHANVATLRYITRHLRRLECDIMLHLPLVYWAKNIGLLLCCVFRMNLPRTKV